MDKLGLRFRCKNWSQFNQSSGGLVNVQKVSSLLHLLCRQIVIFVIPKVKRGEAEAKKKVK